jgi:hypothetical protein
MEHFKCFLLGREFKLITDNRALTALDDRRHYVRQKLNIKYKEGCEIPHVDGLSRILTDDVINTIAYHEEIKIFKINFVLVNA